MAKIKSGMLCWITKALVPENNGLVVTVDKVYIGPDFSPIGEDQRWWVDSSEPVALRKYYPDGTYELDLGTRFILAQQQLIPINDPDAQLDDVRDLELQE